MEFAIAQIEAMSISHSCWFFVNLGINQILFNISHGFLDLALFSTWVFPLSGNHPLVKVHEQNEDNREENEKHTQNNPFVTVLF